MTLPRSRLVSGVALAALFVAGCGVVRPGAEPGEPDCPSYAEAVGPMLENQCGACHGRSRAGGYSVATWKDALERRDDGTFRVKAGDPDALLLAAARGALKDAKGAEVPGHQPLSKARVSLLTDWVVRCNAAPGSSPDRPRYHPAGWATPSDEVNFHGLALRATGYLPLKPGVAGAETFPLGGEDAGTVRACRGCHGDDLRGGKAAVDCNACHARGPLDCGTCHGDATSPAPPRSLSGSRLTSTTGVGAHRTHVLGTATRAPLGCDTCHPPVKDFWDDGHVYRGGVFDGSRVATVAFSDAGVSASWDRATATCTNTACHAPRAADTAATHHAPTWTKVGQGEAACGACHGLPPSTHVDGRCQLCHGDGYADGGVNAATHLDRVVTLRGNGQCDGCHAGPATAPFRDVQGRSDPKVPSVGAHDAHLRASRFRGPLACAECHVVPAVVSAPGHLDSTSPAEVFAVKPASGGLAWTDGAQPVYSPATGTCANVYCHGSGAKLAADQAPWLMREPLWTGGASQAACAGCHSLPPQDGRPEHDGGTLLTCGTCHGKSISPTSGRLLFQVDSQTGAVSSKHLDGVVTLN